jgi:hypothetical protein
MKSTKAGTGKYLELTFEVMQGTFKGRRVWARLNLDNPKAEAEQIARATLSAVCRAVSVLTPNDSTELHNLPLVIHVVCRKQHDTGEITNEIKGYSRKGPATPPTPQPGADTTPPWKRP